MRRDKSHSGAFTNEFVSCLTLSCIHRQELLLLVLLLVLLATGILHGLPGLTSCRCDNIGLVSGQYRACVVDSGWAENYMPCITVLYVQGILILSLLIFMRSLYSLKNFYIYLLVQVSNNAMSSKKYYVVVFVYMYMYVEK